MLYFGWVGSKGSFGPLSILELPLTVNAIFFGEINHGFNGFLLTVIDLSSRAEDVTAVFTAVVDEVFAVRFHFEITHGPSMSIPFAGYRSSSIKRCLSCQVRTLVNYYDFIKLF